MTGLKEKILAYSSVIGVITLLKACPHTLSHIMTESTEQALKHIPAKQLVESTVDHGTARAFIYASTRVGLKEFTKDFLDSIDNIEDKQYKNNILETISLISYTETNNVDESFTKYKINNKIDTLIVAVNIFYTWFKNKKDKLTIQDIYNLHLHIKSNYPKTYIRFYENKEQYLITKHDIDSFRLGIVKGEIDLSLEKIKLATK